MTDSLDERASPLVTPAPNPAGPERSAGDVHRVSPDRMTWRCDPAALPFATTEEVNPELGVIGQERAANALAFGLEMQASGFHIFVSGQTGTGRTQVTRALAERAARERPTPEDLLYVNNFSAAAYPTAILLPPGQGTRLARAMDELTVTVQREIRRTFEVQAYRQRRDKIHETMERDRDQLIQQTVERAAAQGFDLTTTPMGVMAVPVVHGHPMTAEEFAQLPAEEQHRRQEAGDALAAEMRDVLERGQAMDRDAHVQIAELDREVARATLVPLIREQQTAFAQYPAVVDYLGQVLDDMVQRIDELRQYSVAELQAGEKQAVSLAEQLAALGRGGPADRYRVNVLVDNQRVEGAPVVFEPNPTYYNLLGRIEYQSRFGGALTDFRMIEPGALHRANGGYLVLQAFDVLSNPFSWDALKRALRTGEIRIENMGEQLAPVPVATLRPKPIPLTVKVVLIGSPALYYLLYFNDEDFRKLFTVKADFDVELARTSERLGQYAGFISRQVREQKLRHLDRGAVARVVEYGARLAEHQEKLSTEFQQIAEVVAEASYWATKAASQYVLAEHVERAISQKRYRSNLVEEKLRQLIAEGTILLDTTGARTGQINGLSILDLGDYSFGLPVRVTAHTAVGAEGVINVEREAHMSGRVHNKAFLILTSVLTARYGQDKPLALAAKISFEQTYDEVEGDSASSTELYALISCLADLPLRQDIAVTGSVNQHGEVQAVGGVTRKIEGFFDVCRLRGLTGTQGVLIPAANLPHLLLREDVVQAAQAAQFHIWAVRTIDEGLEILTGVRAGARQQDGSWEPGTINDRADQRLRDYAGRLQAFSRPVERSAGSDRVPAEIGPRSPRVGES